MMSKYLSLLLTFLIISFYSVSQNTTIEGKVPGAEGKTIRVISYSDQITYLKKKIASTQIDSDGNFLIKLNLRNTIFAYLSINCYRAEIYLEPKTTYKINIPLVDYNNIDERLNPYLNPKNFDIEILNTNDKELNTLIQKFNIIFNEFILKNFRALYNRDIAKIDTFRILVNDSFPSIENDYFESYVKYKIAAMEQLARVCSNDSLAKKYFLNQPILYDNVEYMDFFNNFFVKYITASSKKISREDLISTINKQKSYFALADVLGKDTLLMNEVLREMVMLKGLQDIYNMPDFEQKNVLEILKQVSSKSKFEQHQIIAENLITIFTKLKPGTKAPDFALKDVDGKTVSLNELKGKYVYLLFWNTKCISCISEIELMSGFKGEEYRDSIEFIGISTDKDVKSMHDYLKGKDYNGTFLHYENNFDLLEDYDVKLYPLFVLIDKKGNILKYPARKPSENGEHLFIELTKPKEKEYKLFEK